MSNKVWNERGESTGEYYRITVNVFKENVERVLKGRYDEDSSVIEKVIKRVKNALPSNE